MKTIASLVVAILFLSMVAAAASAAGKWKAEVPSREGKTRETTFTFKVEGGALTGSMSGRQGEVPLTNGKISGDTISFVVESQRGKQTYTGTISGDEIKFKREGGQGQPREFTAKRIQ